MNGRNWVVLEERNDNERPATSAGDLLYFSTDKLRFVRVCFPESKDRKNNEARVVEIAGYRLDDGQIASKLAWNDLPDGLHGGWGSIDERYARDDVPQLKSKTTKWTGTAWRGERVAAQLMLWTASGAEQVRFNVSPLRGPDSQELPADCIRARFVRYVLAEGRLEPDVLDTAQRLDLEPHSVRPIWVSVDVPANAHPGKYSCTLTVQAAGGVRLPFEMSVEVLPAVLPPPADWSFHLDLWQNPWAIARYHGVEPWSAEHWLAMEPTMRMLAEAGQKCITVSLIDKPWGKQTYDPYGSMIQWIRGKDGTWRYDYSIFDQYVEFCQGCGITKQINCHSMVPWTTSYQYRDEATGDDRVVRAEPGTLEYEEHWRPFLVDFVKHLKEKGWLDIAAIAMDERPLEPMQKVIAFLKETAPELKLALAGNYHPQITMDVHDYCIFISRPPTMEQIAERVQRSMPTTFYVCCGPLKPNTFPFSPPAESAWMGWHAAMMGYTGFLRWAYDSWTADPLYDTNHVRWPGGDCFVVYPGGRSSIRFERLREGIQDYEKIRLLRAAIEKSQDVQLKKEWDDFRKLLNGFKYDERGKVSHTEPVNAGKKALEVLSRRVGTLTAGATTAR
jgi:hypothetical protein